MGNAGLKNENIIFFDGVCHLCNAFVDTLISKDKKRVFKFAPLQGETAKALLSDQDRNSLETVIYFEKGNISRRSSAILKIFWRLGGVYRLSSAGFVLPASLRDFFYKVVAKNRYKWFGEREFCRLPTPEERSYLLP